ncbi:MAG: 4-hydroxythreonine-4-phosphate dehydrogenase PdxA [Bacteroidetes bacterium]|nr:4-hydroxythreonine-4-phosphate dehydrogenase PdxA [Bacteroidota bacterium]
MATETEKPIIGFTCGDLNGIGIELIIKTLADKRILDMCIPVVFASNKCINFYRKSLPDINFTYQAIKDFKKLNIRDVNIFNCWEEEVQINPGTLNETGGKYAYLSLKQAVASLQAGDFAGLVTAPIHKKNIQSSSFAYSGHTPFLKDAFQVQDVLMLMTSQNLRVALVTEHVPVKEIAGKITKQLITGKLSILHESLRRDFGINKPKIAVLSLNPHAGDEGLIGTEEESIIKPAIKEMKEKDMLVVGPFPADAFFARAAYNSFDAVLAMYHDQGLIPFKSLALGNGINFSAGLPIVRTSPDHGTAFDIAGQGIADESSFRAAFFECIDLLRRRKYFDEDHKNPLKKMSSMVTGGVADEVIRED